MQKLLVVVAGSALALSSAAFAQSGANLVTSASSLGAPLLSTQTNASNYGAGLSGGQASSSGSRLDRAWGTISGGKLKLLIAGNLESNFNKMWIMFDDGTAGQSTLRGDNADGGFGEINGMDGMKFDAGFTPSRGIRIELGGGFYGVRGFTLPNGVGGTGGDINTGGGFGSLPLSNVVGNNGVNFGWDNQGTNGAGPGTVSSGWNFDIDLATYFGNASLSTIRVSTFITNGGANNLSNQVLGPGNTNYPNPNNFDWGTVAGDQFFTIVPAPGAAALLGLGALVAGRRRRA